MLSQEPTPLYEGKAKQLYPGPDADTYLMRFKDSATAFNNKKKAEVAGKGSLNCRISTTIFDFLKAEGIATHHVKTLSDTEMLVKKVAIVPLEVVIRNIAAGSLTKRLGIPEKTEIQPPLVEFFYKMDALDDPLVTTDHIYLMKLATPEELSEIRSLALKINDLLRGYFRKLGIVLVDFKLEFGKDSKGRILLADEITPDGCRLWDAVTMEIMDKDRFRKDMGGFMEAYQVVWDRIQKGSR